MIREHSAYLSDYRTVAIAAAEDFIPDGLLSKPAWTRVPRVRLQNAFCPEVIIPDVETEVAALWTRSSLYLAFWCRYIELNTYRGEDSFHQRWELWNRDVVEAFINPYPERLNRYWEFEVAPNNEWIDLAIDLEKTPSVDVSWYSGFRHATLIEELEKRWTCEMQIPVTSMEIPLIRPGVEWRINFYRCDGPGDDSQRRFLAWSPTLARSFHVPSRFGLIEFEK